MQTGGGGVNQLIIYMYKTQLHAACHGNVYKHHYVGIALIQLLFPQLQDCI